MNIKEALLGAKKALKDQKVSEPEGSAEFLLAHLLGISRTKLLANQNVEIEPKILKKYQKYLDQRKSHRPVWQITGYVPFWGMALKVNKNVLVPRPETEILVKMALDEIRGQKNNLRILDVGTGAGPIAIALAMEIKKPKTNHQIFASDISGQTLRVARKNAEVNGVEENIRFKKSDLMRGWKGHKFDLVCANLPYIPHEEMATLAYDVHHFEPRIALDGGKNGLEIYDEFFRQIPDYLEESAIILCEIGYLQGKMLQKIAEKYLPEAKFKISDDLAGIDRIFEVRLTKKTV